MTNEKALQGALNAAKLGLKIVPLTPYTHKGKAGEAVWGKIARIEDWPNLATDDPAQIRKWADGDFTGTSSKSRRPCEHWGASLDGFIAFDVDAPTAGEELRNLFVRAGFQDIIPTFTTRTGRGGNHFLYRQPEGYALGNSVGKENDGLAPKLDTRGGAGGYIVLPGTINPVSDGEYTILCDAEIATLPVEVAEIVKSKVGEARTKKTAGIIERRGGSIPDTMLKMKRATEWLLEKDGGVEGEGGDADALLVGQTLADIGLSEERAKTLARAIYNPRCAPEWDGDALDRKIHNGYAYRANEVGCDDPDLAVGMFGEEYDNKVREEDAALFPIRNSGEFNLTPPPVREALIENFIAHGKYLTLIYGRGGSGKSLLGWQMLRELARRKTFLGLRPGEVCSHLRPLVLSLEEPREDVHFRYCKQTQRIAPEGGGKEPLWCDLRGSDPRILRINKGQIEAGDGLDSLIRIVKANEINLLLIDSLSRIFPGNENDRAAVTAFGRFIDRFTEVTGCHVLLLAHTNKAGAFSGSSGWEAICRQMFLITSEMLDGKTVYTMTAEKTNENARGAYVRYKFDDWYYVPVSHEEYEKLKAVSGRSKKSSEVERAIEKATAILDIEGEMRYGDLQKAMKNEGFDRGALNFALESLTGMGEVISEKRYDSLANRQIRFLRLVEEREA